MKEPTVHAGTLCSICIATYDRLGLLFELLDSLEAQELPPNVRLEMIVVENDARRQAESLVEDFRRKSAHSYIYAVQPEKNISLTRNAAVSVSRGDFILFIDDDETAASDWAARLLSAQRRYDADAVFGYLRPRFHEEAPSWVRSRRLYYPPMPETGSPARAAYTGNCLIKASALKSLSGPFDPEYGLTGGEDVHLFQRLRKRGARFVTCKEAVIDEKIPPDRTTFSYLFKRWLRGGYIHTRRHLELGPGSKTARSAHMLIKSLGFGTVSLFLAVACLPVRDQSLFWMMRAGSNLGRFLAVLGYNYEGYL